MLLLGSREWLCLGKASFHWERGGGTEGSCYKKCPSGDSDSRLGRGRGPEEEAVRTEPASSFFLPMPPKDLFCEFNLIQPTRDGFVSWTIVRPGLHPPSSHLPRDHQRSTWSSTKLLVTSCDGRMPTTGNLEASGRCVRKDLGDLDLEGVRRSGAGSRKRRLALGWTLAGSEGISMMWSLNSF